MVAPEEDEGKQCLSLSDETSSLIGEHVSLGHATMKHYGRENEQV
jgi:hypothetical protein